MAISDAESAVNWPWALTVNVPTCVAEPYAPAVTAVLVMLNCVPDTDGHGFCLQAKGPGRELLLPMGNLFAQPRVCLEHFFQTATGGALKCAQNIFGGQRGLQRVVIQSHANTSAGCSSRVVLVI